MSARPRFATRAARTTASPPSASRPLVPPVHLANVYVFEDLGQVDAVWEGREPGYVYGRFGTPNHTMLEETLAALEGGESALATASGMGALSAFLLGGLRPGDHVVAGQDLYGATTALLREQAGRWGIRVTFVDATEAAAVEAAITDATRAIFVEAISNPLLRLADLPGLGALARRRGLRSWWTAPSRRPRCSGRWSMAPPRFTTAPRSTSPAMATSRRGSWSGRVPWSTPRGPRRYGSGSTSGLSTPGSRCGACGRSRSGWSGTPRTRSSWREFLAGRPEIARVHYPGLPDHPQHRLARTLFPSGFGGMLSFELAGGAGASQRLFGALAAGAPGGEALIAFAPSFGDVTTTWTYPARTSHRPLSDDERAKLGIGPGLVRLSVGIEDVEDLKESLDLALRAAAV